MNQPVTIEFPWTKPPTKEYTWRYPWLQLMCSRVWPCWTSMGGEALGPEKGQCPSVVESQDRESGVGGLVSRGRATKKGNNIWNVNNEYI